MYRFQYISDLHLEFGARRIKAVAPYLLLAGDIGYPEESTFRAFLQECSRAFEAVFFTPGNHEYYQNYKKKKGAPILPMDVVDGVMRHACAALPNVVYLNNASYDIDGALRIVGSTLWSKPDPRAPLINDYDQIYKTPEENIAINDVGDMHDECVRYLEREIQTSPLPLLVMTHHLPSPQMVVPKYKRMPYKAYISHFACDVERLFRPPVKAWICGHSHSYNWQSINGIPCHLNACGYPTESTGAKWDAVLEIDLV